MRVRFSRAAPVQLFCVALAAALGFGVAADARACRFAKAPVTDLKGYWVEVGKPEALLELGLWNDEKGQLWGSFRLRDRIWGVLGSFTPGGDVVLTRWIPLAELESTSPSGRQKAWQKFGGTAVGHPEYLVAPARLKMDRKTCELVGTYTIIGVSTNDVVYTRKVPLRLDKRAEARATAKKVTIKVSRFTPKRMEELVKKYWATSHVGKRPVEFDGLTLLDTVYLLEIGRNNPGIAAWLAKRMLPIRASETKAAGKPDGSISRRIGDRINRTFKRVVGKLSQLHVQSKGTIGPHQKYALLDAYYWLDRYYSIGLQQYTEHQTLPVPRMPKDE